MKEELVELLKTIRKHLRYAVIRRDNYTGRETTVFKSPKKADAEEYVRDFHKVGDNTYVGKGIYSYYIHTVWSF